MDKNGQLNPKPTDQIIEKLETITGIKSRRYVNEDEDSVPLMTRASNPVSYTHLDVYKRQEYNQTFQGKIAKNGIHL